LVTAQNNFDGNKNNNEYNTLIHCRAVYDSILSGSGRFGFLSALAMKCIHNISLLSSSFYSLHCLEI